MVNTSANINKGAGIGCKPVFSGVPMTHHEHSQQHRHGENYWGGREFFDQWAEHYRLEWVKDRLKRLGAAKIKNIMEVFTV